MKRIGVILNEVLERTQILERKILMIPKLQTFNSSVEPYKCK